MVTPFARSAARDAILARLATAPREGVDVATIMGLPSLVDHTRAALDNLLHRMVNAGEVERVGRGRYVGATAAMPERMQPQTAPPRTPPAAPSIAERASHGETALPSPKRKAVAAGPRPEPMQSSRTVAAGKAEILPQARGKRDDARFGPKRPADTWDDDREAVAAVWTSRSVPEDRRDPKRPATPAEIDAFCARVACLCVKYALSPPFRLRALAGAWASEGIPLSKCLRTIENYLENHAAKCQSGATDRLFRWVDIFLRGPASSSRPARADHGRR